MYYEKFSVINENGTEEVGQEFDADDDTVHTSQSAGTPLDSQLLTQHLVSWLRQLQCPALLSPGE